MDLKIVEERETWTSKTIPKDITELKSDPTVIRISINLNDYRLLIYEQGIVRVILKNIINKGLENCAKAILM